MMLNLPSADQPVVSTKFWISTLLPASVTEDSSTSMENAEAVKPTLLIIDIPAPVIVFKVTSLTTITVSQQLEPQLTLLHYQSSQAHAMIPIKFWLTKSAFVKLDSISLRELALNAHLDSSMMLLSLFVVNHVTPMKFSTRLVEFVIVLLLSSALITLVLNVSETPLSVLLLNLAAALQDIPTKVTSV